jgi:hypothetical protein
MEGYHNQNNYSDAEENEEILEAEVNLHTSYDIMKTGFNSFDEFQYF